jgi:hypothetical protein
MYSVPIPNVKTYESDTVMHNTVMPIHLHTIKIVPYD